MYNYIFFLYCGALNKSSGSKFVLFIYNHYIMSNTTIIQLEDHDNVSSIKEKINNSPTQRVLLVWPNHGYLDLKELDYLVILRFAYYLDVQIAVVLDDPAVVRLFKEYGISTFRSIPESQKKPWRKPKIIAHVDKFAKVENEEIINNFIEASINSTRQPPKIFRWLIFLIGIASFFSLIIFLIPSATISLKPETDLQTATIPVRADPSIKQVNITGAVPVHISDIMVEGELQGVSSGTIRIPDKEAMGEVVFRNLTDQRVIVPAGTIVRTDSEPQKRFETLIPITLPPRVDAVITTEIKSLIGGTDGNAAAMSISIVEGDFGANLEVSNPNSITGGVDIKTFSPTESDYGSTKEELLEKLKESAKEKIIEEFSNDYWIPETSIEFVEVIEEIRFPEIGDPAERYSLYLEVEYSAWMIKNEDLIYLSNLVLDSEKKSEFLPVTGSTDFEIDDDSIIFSNNLLNFDLRAEQLLYSEISHVEIIQQIAGKRSQDAINLLLEKYGEKSNPTITIVPRFWDYLPFLPFRINLMIDE